jgi:hypothetical protein
MTPKQYHKAPGINSTALSRYAEGPDIALMPMEPKSVFEIGNAFEALVEDRACGTNKFGERFFYSKCSGGLPEKLVGWIEGLADLSTKYVLKKDGGLNNQKKTLHAYLDECQENPGMVPIGAGDAEMLKRMVDNFFKMEIYGQSMSDLLSVCDFQEPVFWVDDWGREKKALFDAITVCDGRAYIFDFKSAANPAQFVQMLKRKYHFQASHYEEGATVKFGSSMPMMFLASYKCEPYLAQPWGIDPESRDMARAVYLDTVAQYAAWNEAGKPSRGWAEYDEVKLWFK